MLVWLLIGGLVLLLVLRLSFGPGDAAADSPPEEPVAPEPEPEMWTAEALAKYGTPETVADLVEQGRGEELRGLGYEGDLPGE